MPTFRRLAIVTLAAGTALAALAAPTNVSAQAFPNRPIRVLVPFGPGAPSDTVIRWLSDRVTRATGATFVIDNRVGANGMLAARETARATPDGYTMMISSNSAHAANMYLYKDPGYNAVKDFAPITGVTKNPHVVVVRSSLPVNSIKELVAWAKANPGKLNVGAGNTGTIAIASSLMRAGDFEGQVVQYKSPPNAITDLVGGRVDLSTIDYFVVSEFIRTGQARAIAITSASPIKALPDAAPVADTYPGFEVLGWLATFAPAGTPPAIVGQLNKMFTDVLRGKEAEEHFERQGVHIFASTPAELGAWVEGQVKLWNDMLTKAGVEKQ